VNDHRKRGAAWATVALLASGSVAISTAKAYATACLSDESASARITQIGALDERAEDAAVARAIRRASLTPLVLTARERPGNSNGRDRTAPLPPGQHQISARPLDPNEPDGPAIETRTSADGTTHVYLTEPAVTINPCAPPSDPIRDFRFARAADGRVVPVYITYRIARVVLTRCGCVGGCGHMMPAETSLSEFELPVQNESEVAAPIRVRVVLHTVLVRGSNRHCSPVP
jgi:hypothetical protein